MALIQTSLIWVTYAVAIGILLIVSGIFVFVYQTPRDRSASVTIVCLITMLALLATVFLMPVDIALVSSTTRSSLGRKKDWATPDAVDNIIFQLKIVYYTLYSLDAILCLIVVPFTYFYHEEYDEVATEEGSQTIATRIWGAFKYTIAFILLVVIVFLVGFFVPVARNRDHKHMDLDFFKDLLAENRKCSIMFTELVCIMLTSYRWGASPYLCRGSLGYHWHRTVLHLHRLGPRVAPDHSDQNRTTSLCTIHGCDHGLSA